MRRPFFLPVSGCVSQGVRSLRREKEKEGKDQRPGASVRKHAGSALGPSHLSPDQSEQVRVWVALIESSRA